MVAAQSVAAVTARATALASEPFAESAEVACDALGFGDERGLMGGTKKKPERAPKKKVLTAP